MTLDKILELEDKSREQKLESELEDARRKNKEDTMMLCINLVAQQIALNALVKVI